MSINFTKGDEMIIEEAEVPSVELWDRIQQKMEALRTLIGESTNVIATLKNQIESDYAVFLLHHFDELEQSHNCAAVYDHLRQEYQYDEWYMAAFLLCEQLQLPLFDPAGAFDVAKNQLRILKESLQKVTAQEQMEFVKKLKIA